LQEATYLADNYDNNRLKAYARGYLGELYEHTQHYSEALQLTNEAIFLSQSYPENLYYWEWQKGRVLQKQQDLVGAEAAYKHALYLVNPIKTRMITGQRDFVDMFYEDIQPIYYHLIDILLKQAKMATKPLERVHRLNQAKNVLEQQKAAEMQNYFQDECISVIHVPKLQQVEPHTAIIHPILLEDRIELLLTLHDSLRQFTVPIPRQVVYETVITFQKTLQQRTTFMFIHQALALYNWLIAPLRKVLDIYEIKTLVIVPDGPLRMIPMSALHDGNHFLIEDFAIAIVPGIDMTDTWPLSRTDANILLNGLSESVQNFSPLPNVPRELKQISAIFSQAKVLLNRDFLIKEMDQALEQTPYTFIHIASHGQFHRDHRRTFLLTYDSKLTMERLQQLLKINEVRQWAVELLTLSACQTAVGDERASLGLAGVALKAGARSALASLWFVNDESTSALISKFYQELTKPGVSKAQALQQAQKQLMTINRFNHPAYWAPFLLIGNWF
jgi:CHAT domain-containing protein